MCDYSLFEHPNRLAVEGEDLVTHRFPSRSLGLVSSVDLNRRRTDTGTPTAGRKSIWAGFKQLFSEPFSEPATPVAVCVPHSAKLMLYDIPVPVRECYRIGGTEEVMFVQTTASANVHRDAIRFKDGQQFVLQLLPEGLHIRVVSLEAHSDEARVAPTGSEAERVSLQEMWP